MFYVETKSYTFALIVLFTGDTNYNGPSHYYSHIEDTQHSVNRQKPSSSATDTYTTLNLSMSDDNDHLYARTIASDHDNVYVNYSVGK